MEIEKIVDEIGESMHANIGEYDHGKLMELARRVRVETLRCVKERVRWRAGCARVWPPGSYIDGCADEWKWMQKDLDGAIIAAEQGKEYPNLDSMFGEIITTTEQEAQG